MNACLVYRPTSALWWVAVLGAVVSVYSIAVVFGRPAGVVGDGMWLFVTVLALALVVPVLLIALVDRYRSRVPAVLGLAFLLGGTIAPVVALPGNRAAGEVVRALLGPTTGETWEAALTAPFVEEWAKGTCALLVLLVAGRAMRQPMHGLLVGAFAGLGFEFTENVVYSLRAESATVVAPVVGGTMIALVRGVSGLLASHWLYSGLIGLGLAILLGGGTVLGWSLGRRIVTFGLCAAASSTVHLLWNSPLAASIPARIALTLCSLALFLVLGCWAADVDRRVLDPVRLAAPDPVDGYTFGTLRERRAARRAARAEDGRRAVRALRAAERVRLDALQAGVRAVDGATAVPVAVPPGAHTATTAA